ncbi:MAG: hypothetical protein R3B57_04375 [Phycisphaerales bacterium]
METMLVVAATIQAVAAIAAAVFAVLILISVREASRADGGSGADPGFTPATLYIITLMDEQKDARALLREYVKDGASGRVRSMTDDEELAAESVCRSFDILGLFDREGWVSPRLADRFYSTLLLDLWEPCLKGHVERQRQGRKLHYWELLQLVDRVKHVPANHPAHRGERDWAEDPRRAP